MTDDELEAIRARRDDAVQVEQSEDWSVWYGDGYRVATSFLGESISVEYEETAEFIAHAVKDIPALLAEVFRLRALVGEPEYLTSAPSDTAAQIVAAIRARCTPPHEAYTKGGDVLIAAVADWIENPPEWVEAPWLSPGPEWEYGVRHVARDGFSVWTWHENRAAAESDFASCGMNCDIARRIRGRAPGPVEPVPETGDDRG